MICRIFGARRASKERPFLRQEKQALTELDEALVVRSRRGDRAAFEELVRRTARLLFAHLYLKTSDVHKTEDLVQETFLIAWRSIADLDEPKTFRAWLTTIANSS